MQNISSAKTSRNQIPAAFKTILKYLNTNSTNLDFGGGKFDLTTKWLRSHNITNLVYDKYNRTEEHNTKVLSNNFNSITCFNVLNVIKEDNIIIEILNTMKQYNVPVYISCYEKNKTNIGEITRDGYQRNQTLKNYLPLIKQVFNNVSIKNNVIIAKNT